MVMGCNTRGYGMQYTWLWDAIHVVMGCNTRGYGVQYTWLWGAIHVVMGCNTRGYGVQYTWLWAQEPDSVLKINTKRTFQDHN